MKVWPIDPLVPRNLRLEVPEKLPQGLNFLYTAPRDSDRCRHGCTNVELRKSIVPVGSPFCRLVRPSLYCAGDGQVLCSIVGRHTWMRGGLVKTLATKAKW